MMRPEQWSILYYAMSKGTQDTTKTTDTDRYRTTSIFLTTLKLLSTDIVEVRISSKICLFTKVSYSPVEGFRFRLLWLGIRLWT